MRASETVSEASPSSTASQTGVPTQVVQQVQGTQQVGHGLHWGEEALPPPHQEHLFTCLIKIWQLPPPPTHPGKQPSFSSFLTFTAAAGPGKCAGQARPCVTPAAYQYSGATAGKAPGSSLPWGRELLPYCLLVPGLTRVSGKGPIHRPPQLLALGQWPLEARANTPRG